jgi:hypothetical protein
MAHLFKLQGEVFSPDGKVKPMSDAEVSTHNQQQDLADVAYAQSKPDKLVVYYNFPSLPPTTQVYSRAFRPMLTGAHVTTWLGTTLGPIVSAHVYQQNRGRMVSLRANIHGQLYYGRASWDNGSIVRLRKAKRS